MMRNRLLVGLVSVVCLSSLAIAQENAQPPRGRGRGGFGFGGGFNSPGQLVRNEAVQAELKLTDEQKEKLSKGMPNPQEFFGGLQGLSDEERGKKFQEFQDQMKKVVDETLNDDQKKRIKEITIQVRRAGALNDPEVAKAVGLSEEQTKKIKEIVETPPARPAPGAAPAAPGAPGGGFDPEAFRKAREERDAKILAVLDEDQKKKFEELKGEKFDTTKLMPMGPMGGRGRRPAGAN